MELSYDPPAQNIHYGGPSNLEAALYRMLEEQEIEFIAEWRVPGSSYRVDAFDPVAKVAYEADGYPTHFTKKGRKRDWERDVFILATGYVERVVRMTKRELRIWL